MSLRASGRVAPPSKRLTGSRCLCRGCGEYFNRTGTFTAHRVGSFGTIRHPGDRRCLTEAEMRARGWVCGADGFWRTGGVPPAALRLPASRIGIEVPAAISPAPSPTAGDAP